MDPKMVDTKISIMQLLSVLLVRLSCFFLPPLEDRFSAIHLQSAHPNQYNLDYIMWGLFLIQSKVLYINFPHVL